jgi:hypothetical protein
MRGKHPKSESLIDNQEEGSAFHIPSLGPSVRYAENQTTIIHLGYLSDRNFAQLLDRQHPLIGSFLLLALSSPVKGTCCMEPICYQ